MSSSAALFAALPRAERDKRLAALSIEEQASLAYDWEFWSRPAQQWPEGLWRTWLILAGRGFGKTRTGAETILEARRRGYHRMALVAATAGDARDVMVEGESGIMACAPPWDRPSYEPSKRRVTWPDGSLATLYSADEPERLRGPQHDFGWADEVAAWRYREAWDQLMFGLRLGKDPRVVASTTPKPTELVKELVASDTTHLTRGSTYDNAANLAPAFLDTILKRYEGTSLGRQEIYAEILSEVAGALWTGETLEATRVDSVPTVVDKETGEHLSALERIVVAIDPAVTSHKDSDETGIIIAGRGDDKHGYLLEDASLKASPMEWAQRAVRAYHKWDADRIVAEVNQGGDMVETIIRQVDPDVPVTLVRASRGKHARAEPIAALYEQHRIHHVGVFAELEEQQRTWLPGIGWSPDRIDAAVWAFSELMLGSTQAPVFQRL